MTHVSGCWRHRHRGGRERYLKVIEPNHPNPDRQAGGQNTRIRASNANYVGVKNATRSTWLLFTWVSGQCTRETRNPVVLSYTRQTNPARVVNRLLTSSGSPSS
jgi:hypothetical protein